jgi:hypothetical protein
MMNLDKSEKVQMVIWWTRHPIKFPSEARNPLFTIPLFGV